MITEKIKVIFFNIKKNVNTKMKPYNLTASQIILLNYLYENKEKEMFQKDVCEFLSLKHSTVISILKRLEGKELITKKTDYKSVITITKKGIELLETIGIKKGFVENNILKGFSKEERELLSNYLDRIIINMKNI